jgi:L-seryl-tRNA(Ser) seleniumtransferase
VGTTNRTHLKDYEAAVSDRTGLLLAVHPSNYQVVGFTSEVPLEALIELGRARGVPVAHDLGGGVLVDLREYGLPYEPLVSDSVRAGADVVTFSGDKVLGGPQAGILVGRRDAIGRIRQDPLMRALRCGKLTYAALEATLKLFLNRKDLVRGHPALRMLTSPVSTLRRRGGRLLKELGDLVSHGIGLDLEDSVAQSGSGALPLAEIPSTALVVSRPGGSIAQLAAKLRRHDPPVLGYVREECLYLDLRTVGSDELRVVAAALRWAMMDEGK